MTFAPRVLLLGGPTASGKSELALRIAEATGAAVINADSMQLYADLPTLTARPPLADLDRAPHHLYGFLAPTERYSVGLWQRAVLDLIGRLEAPLVIVGGTGLYFRSLIHGLAHIPPVSASIQDEVAALYDRLGEAAFRDKLATRDPQAAERIGEGDRQRLTRAYAVLVETGQSLSFYQSDTRAPLTPDDYRALVLEPPREEIYSRCDRRFAAMLADGALGEVQDLIGRGLTADWPILQVLGAQELYDAAELRLPLPQAITMARQRTRNYAKRQLTWFRGQTPSWPRAASIEEGLRLMGLT